MIIRITVVINILQIERNNKLVIKTGRRYQNISTPDDNNTGSLFAKIRKIIRFMNKMFANSLDANFLIKSIIIIEPNNIRLPE
ncbi:MAG TPA: hypothetical protein ENH98_02620 [archaeon]|nr:hypothetical protein [archaeon]